ncbi:LysM repeat protein [Neomicrococcus aestuarii]|uniref:LysM repeat protein n=1 Tax=Neomicrococcus aestuarii TaxID=556325 RepID=A0A7W8WZT3_9MICC|nr:LysM peptidoglycan-binding domain-containing protein [Neomicrococcus aestuarii]MBB5513741.1 LysM repeat protein [Neomicrococcus aestuarii]
MSAVPSEKITARQPLRVAIASGTTVSALLLASAGATGAMADDVITVKRGDTVSHIAAANKVSVSSVLSLNGLKGSSYIYPGQKLVVRKTGTSSTKTPTKTSTPAKSTTTSSSRSYVVERGDTLSQIARHLGVSLQALLSANNLKVTSTIYPGQRLVTAGGSTSTSTGSTVTKPATSTSSFSSRVYIVQRGDTLSQIAGKLGVTLQKLLTANNLKATSVIYPGQRIVAAGGSTTTTTKPATSTTKPATSTASSKVYTVVRGDSLDSIARRMNSQVDAIMNANKLSSTFLSVGQRLVIPTISSTGSTLVGGSFLGYTYSSSTVNSANTNKQILLSRGVPSKAEMKAMIIRTARAMGVEPQLALGHAMQESSFNHASVSPANAIGVMQVIPSSGAWASDLVGRKLDLLNPQDNVTAGIAIIRSLQRTMPTMQQGIGAYYQGAGSVRKNGLYSDTRSYVSKVLAYRAQFF